MRVLEHKLADARGTMRRAISRLGFTEPARLQPSRLVLRMDDADLPDSLGEGELLSNAVLHRMLVEVVDWLGPIPVSFLASESGGSKRVETLVRFAHRLECPTELVTAGRGIDSERAEALVDCGLQRVQVRIGGVSERIQQSVVGASAIEATDAMMALIAARESRRVDLDIEVVIPWRGRVTEEARAVIGWARQIGVDGYRIEAPWRAEDMPADAELLDELGSVADGFNRTHAAALSEIHAMVANQDGQPGAPQKQGPVRRRRLSCPVGGQRLEISPHGRLSCCPFKTPIPRSESGVEDCWSGAGAHLREIKGCDRVCAHSELAPKRIWG